MTPDFCNRSNTAQELDCHVGVAGLESAGVGRRAGLDAQPRDLPHQLAVPLHELERRHVGGAFDRRVVDEHALQEANPGLADAGLAVRQADEVPPHRAGQGAEHRFGVRQRNAADEMHDRMSDVVCAHRAAPPDVVFVAAIVAFRLADRKHRGMRCPRPDRLMFPVRANRPHRKVGLLPRSAMTHPSACCDEFALSLPRPVD